MNHPITRKSKLLLAGLVAAGSASVASQTDLVASAAAAPYSDPAASLAQLSRTSGLSVLEIAEAKSLVKDLNQLDVVPVGDMKIERAPIIPYSYNVPEPGALRDATAHNRERLARLRAMVTAGRGN